MLTTVHVFSDDTAVLLQWIHQDDYSIKVFSIAELFDDDKIAAPLPDVFRVINAEGLDIDHARQLSPLHDIILLKDFTSPLAELLAERDIEVMSNAQLPLLGYYLKKLEQRRSRTQAAGGIQTAVRTFFEISEDLFAIFSNEGIVLEMSHSWTRLLGYTPADLVGSSLDRFVHPADIDGTYEQLEVLKQGQPVNYFENRLIGKENQVKWFQWRFVPRENEIFAVAREVAAIKEATETSQANGHRFKLITRATTDVLWDWEIDNGSIWWSSNIEDKFGYPIQEAGGIEWWLSKVHQNDRQRVRESLYGAVENHRAVWKEEYLFEKADGSYAFIRDAGEVIFDTNGKPELVIGGMIDLTQQKEREDRLQKSLDFTENLLNTINEGIVLTNLDMEIIMVNRAIEEITGFTKKELIGSKPPFKFWAPNHIEEGLTHIEKLKSGELKEQERVLIRKDGTEFHAAISPNVVRNSNGDVVNFFATFKDITARKQYEHALEESREKLKHMTDALPGAVFTYEVESGSKGRFTYMSKRIESFIGPFNGNMEELSEALWSHIYADDVDEVFNSVMEAVHNFTTWRYDFRFVTPKGEIRWVRGNATPEPGTGDDITVFNGIFTDITEIKNAEEQIILSEKSYRDLFDNSPELLFIMNDNGDFIDVNKAVLNVYGYNKNELLGAKLDFLGVPGYNDMEEIPLLVQKARDGEPQQFLWWAQRKDGTSFPKEVVVRKGSYFGEEVVVASGRDITDRFEAEEKMKASEAFFRQLFENAPLGIVEMNRQSQIVRSNVEFKRMFGFDEGEIVGKAISDFLVPEHLKHESNAIVQRTADGKKTILETERLNRKGETLEVIIYGVPIFLGARFLNFFGIYVDITDRKRAEEDLKRLSNELIKYNSELEQFAYVTSHNLRSPVANMAGLLSILDREQLNEENTKVIGHLDTAIDQLDETLHDLLEVVSHKKAYIEPRLEISFQKILKGIKQSLSSQITESDAEINSDFSKAPGIKYPASHLKSILLNLISNSIKYKHPDRKPVITIYSEPLSDFICLTVKDNGTGFDPLLAKDKVFKMYQRFHPEVEGKGLGLFIVKKQVESLGGMVEVASEEGVGTEFQVYLKKNPE